MYEDMSEIWGVENRFMVEEIVYAPQRYAPRSSGGKAKQLCSIDNDTGAGWVRRY